MSTFTELARDDLGLYTVAVMCVGFAIGMAFLAICFAWDRQQANDEQIINPSPRVPAPRRVSSNRKAARR